MTALIEELKSRDLKTNESAISEWNQQIIEWREAHGLNHSLLEVGSQNGKILPQQVIQSLYKETKGEAFITSDVGQHQMFAAQ